MASKTVSEIYNKARTDPEFLHKLIFSPDSALADFSLTSFERKVLTSHTPEDLIGLVLSNERLECDPHTCNVTQAPFSKKVDSCDATVVRTLESEDIRSESSIEQIIKRAQNDPAFFAKLRDNRKSALKGLSLNDAERKALSANTPEKLLSLLVGFASAGCGGGDTCGHTCSMTCSGGYTMSCGGTCAHTCDYTAGIQLWIEDVFKSIENGPIK